MSLKISSKLSLPEEAVTWVLAFLAKRGAGKTYDAAVLAEEMIKAGKPIVVIDGMGIWWGLRVSNNTKSNGLPIVVFGGEHQDLPLVPEKAQQIARAIVESNISAVLDLSGFSKSVMKKIVAAFVDELYKVNRMERHVFIEEADMFAPQKPMGDDAVCAGAVSSFVRRGGNHNLGVSMITQRSAVLSKDCLTQSDCLVILRTLGPQDKKAIMLWVEENSDEDKTAINKWYDSLKELANGEAWVWHPEKPFKIYKKVLFRKRETFHATRKFIMSPEAGHIKLMDVNDFISKFKAVFEPKPMPKQLELNQSKPTLEPQVFQPQVFSKQTEPKVVPRTPDPRPIVSPITQPKSFVSDGEIVVQQSLPNITIQQVKPNLMIPVEALDQPTTPLGKVLIVLKSDDHNANKWNAKRINKDIQDHGWDSSDTDEAIKQLLRWEVLTDAYPYFKFHTTRVRIEESSPNLQVR